MSEEKIQIEHRGSVIIMCPYCYIKFEDIVVDAAKEKAFCPRCVRSIKFDDLIRATPMEVVKNG